MNNKLLTLEAPHAGEVRNVFREKGKSETASDSLFDRSNCSRLALNIALVIADARAGSLFLWDEFGKEMVLEAANGQDPEQLKRPHVKLGDGVMGRIMRQGNPVLVKDIRDDERFRSFERIGKYRSHSFLCIPLVSRGKLVGVINITERENLSPFDEQDLARAGKYARLIAVDCENLRSSSRPVSFSKKIDTSGEQDYHTAIGKLAANLTHELNNPLDAIRRYVSLAIDQPLEDPMTREYLLKAQKGILRSVRIMTDLSVFSNQYSEDAAKIVDLRALLEGSLNSLQEDEAFQKIAVQKIICESGPIYVEDRGITIVLHNLYKNACHAMHGEGTLTVAIWNQNGSVGIAVQDNGSGVEETIRERIFEPFFSTKDRSEGTGIGLALCREIVERCGGKLTCENSHPQPGACFIFTLPRKKLSGFENIQEKQLPSSRKEGGVDIEISQRKQITYSKIKGGMYGNIS